MKSNSQKTGWGFKGICGLAGILVMLLVATGVCTTEPGGTPTTNCGNKASIPFCCGGTGACTDPAHVDCSPGRASLLNSFIDNAKLTYRHDAMDYQQGSPQGQGCTSCGGGVTGLPGELPRLRVHRIHHYQWTSISSFSSGVSWDYDIALELVKSDDNNMASIRIDDPQSTVGSFNVYDAPDPTHATDNDGVYSNVERNCIHDITLYDSTGAITADQSQAATAVLTTLDGKKYTFEVIITDDSYPADNPDPNIRNARLTKIEDRNGNDITVNYVFAANATMTDLGSDRSRLFEISTVSDAYGQTLTCTYTLEAGSRWCITRIDLPNGQHLTYGYGNAGDGLYTLTSVTHPDTTVTTIGCSYDSATQCMKLDIFDPAAAPTHRKKSIYLTNFTWQDPVTMALVSQPYGRIRMVVNGAGETSYINWGTSASGLDTTYVYQGGNSLYRFISNLNEPVETSYAKTFDLNNDPSTYTWELVADYTTDNDRLTSETDSISTNDPANHTLRPAIKYTLDGNGAILSTAYHDATHDDTTYNGFREPLTYSDRLGRITHYTYDTTGNMTQKVAAYGTADAATYTYTYNSLGQMTSATDADGNETDYAYDATTHLLTSVTQPADVTGGSRGVTSYTYDSYQRLQAATDPTGRVTTYGYDVNNRLVSITYADSSTETSTYQTSSSSPDQGLVISSKDRTGFNTTYAYDGDGREITRTLAASTSVAGITTTTYLDGTTQAATVTVNGNTTTYGYDYRLRQVTSTVQPHVGDSLTTTTVYDAIDRVDHVADAYGRNTYNVYDINDRVVRTVQETVPGGVPSGSRDQTSLAALSRVTTANAAYLITDMAFDAEGEITSMTDGNGNITNETYDNQGRQTDVTQAYGTAIAGHTHTVYDAQGNVTETDSPRYFDSSDTNGYNKDKVTMTYTGRNLLASRSEAPGVTGVAGTESYTYYLDGREATHTDFRSNVWTTTWGACCARLQSQAEPAATVDTSGTDKSAARTYRHNDYGDLTHQGIISDITAATFPTLPTPTNTTDLPDANTVQEVTTKFDARHRPIAQTVWFAPLGSVDANNPPIAGDGGVPAANGLTTRWVYDENLTDSTGLDATYATQIATLGSGFFGTGSVGSAVQMTNPNGETFAKIYDGAGRTVMTIDGLGHTKTATYDVMVSSISGAPGDLLATTRTDALSHSVTGYTDAEGRTLAVKDQLNKVTTMGYDADGNAISIRDPNSIGQDCVFDARNRKTQCTDTHSDVTKWAYDANSNLTSFTDAKSKSDASVYDGRERRTSYTSRLASDTTAYVYDANGNNTSLTDAESKQTQYTFDARNLKTLETYPDDNVILGTGINDHISYTYDAAHRVTTRKDQKNETIGYTWDMASRLTTRSYPDSNNDTYTFDNASRMLTAASARYANTVTRTYDAAGRLTSDKLTVGGTDYNVGFGFDNADRNTGITYPDASSVTRTYTDRNQLYTVGYTPSGGSPASIATRTYDDGMRLSTTTYGNSLVETRTYTSGDNTTASISVPSVTSFTYTYDANKNKTAEADGILTNYAWTTVPGGSGSGYDDKDRLINWSRTGGDTQTWGLTKVGDWSSTVVNGTTDTRTHNDVHELTARTTPSAALSYDLKGNLVTNYNSQTYAWNFDNKLATATVSSTTWTYTYDALGRRISKSDGTTTTLFVSAVNQEIAEYTNGTLTKKYVFGDYIDEPLTMINFSGTSETTYYYHANSQFCVAAMTDSAGAAQERYVYTPYGKQTILDGAGTTVRTSSSIGNPFTYTGRRWDYETGLYYYRARYYDADLGRLIGKDPLGYADGMNGYTFVGDNPINRVDPSGLVPYDPLSADGSATILAQEVANGQTTIQAMAETLGISVEAAQPLVHAASIGIQAAALVKLYRSQAKLKTTDPCEELRLAQNSAQNSIDSLTKKSIPLHLKKIADPFDAGGLSRAADSRAISGTIQHWKNEVENYENEVEANKKVVDDLQKEIDDKCGHCLPVRIIIGILDFFGRIHGSD